MKPSAFLKTLKNIHLLLTLALTIAIIVSSAVVGTYSTKTLDNEISLFLVPIFALVGYFGSQLVFQRTLKKIDPRESLVAKLKKYRSALYIKYALITFPALYALYVYYNSGNALPLVIAICLTAYLFVQKPTPQNLEKNLPLKMDEQKQLNI